jgi:hypothetical protein
MTQNFEAVGSVRRRAVSVLALVALATLLAGSSVSADDEPPADEYARVEVRGTLRKPDDGPRPVKGYRIVIGQGKDAQQYRLVLTDDDETQRMAAGLAGQVVVVTGDLRIKEEVSFETRAGKRYIIGEIKVKTLKKVEPTKK